MKSFLTLQQLKKRISQLNSLIAKFPTVRSAVRRWGFELVTLEGMVERLEARKPENLKQLTICEVKPMEYTREEAAKLIKKHLENIKGEQYQANIWLKEGRVRVYLRDLAFANKKDKGFFAFNSDGSPLFNNISGSGSGQIADQIRKVLKDVSVLPDTEAEQKIQSSKEAYKKTFASNGLPRRLTQEEVDQLLLQPKTEYSGSSEWCFGAADEESF